MIKVVKANRLKYLRVYVICVIIIVAKLYDYKSFYRILYAFYTFALFILYNIFYGGYYGT